MVVAAVIAIVVAIVGRGRRAAVIAAVVAAIFATLAIESDGGDFIEAKILDVAVDFKANYRLSAAEIATVDGATVFEFEGVGVSGDGEE